VVLDNLREGVIQPDWYEPGLSPVYAALLAHHGVVADPCRVRDPNRRGTVESSTQHAQGALKGRTVETLDAQNTWLADWEVRWASRRIHGRKKHRWRSSTRKNGRTCCASNVLGANASDEASAIDTAVPE
jgi:transposase